MRDGRWITAKVQAKFSEVMELALKCRPRGVCLPGLSVYPAREKGASFFAEGFYGFDTRRSVGRD